MIVAVVTAIPTWVVVGERLEGTRLDDTVAPVVITALLGMIASFVFLRWASGT